MNYVNAKLRIGVLSETQLLHIFLLKTKNGYVSDIAELSILNLIRNQETWESNHQPWILWAIVPTNSPDIDRGVYIFALFYIMGSY